MLRGLGWCFARRRSRFGLRLREPWGTEKGAGMDDFERQVFEMGERAKELSDAAQDEMSRGLLGEASDALLKAAKHLRTHAISPPQH
jgi:hypothetical protein